MEGLEEASSWTELKPENRAGLHPQQAECALAYSLGRTQPSPKAAVTGPLRQSLLLTTLSPVGRKVSSSFLVSELGSSSLSPHRPLVNYHNSSPPEYFAFVLQLRRSILLPHPRNSGSSSLTSNILFRESRFPA